jgi:spore germination protein KC
MRKRILLLIIMILLCVNIGGCFSYKDINRSIMVTALGIDIDPFDNIVLYAEAFLPARGEQIEVGDERKEVFVSKAKSLFEAARNLSLMSNYNIYFSQCRSVILTEKAAQKGLDNYLDLIARNQGLHLRSYVFITPENLENIMHVNVNEEKFVGIFLSELAQTSGESSRGTKLRIDELFNNRLQGANVNLINIIETKNNNTESRIGIAGLAVMKDDIFLDTLTHEETMAFNFLNNTFKRGTINTGNPEVLDKLVTIEILRSKTKGEIDYDGEKIHLKKTIKADVNVAFVEKSIHITNDGQRYSIKQHSEEYIKAICTKLFEDYKSKDIDIFDIERMMNMKYPKSKIKNYLEITELEVDAEIRIKESSEIFNFQ